MAPSALGGSRWSHRAVDLITSTTKGCMVTPANEPLRVVLKEAGGRAERGVP